jgi:phosphoglycolate phosphatase
MVGDGARAMVEKGLNATGGIPSADFFETAVDAFFVYYAAHLADTSQPFPGVVTCLARLAEQGYAMGVCTNKSERFSHDLLSRLGLSGFFGAVVGGDSLPVRKPHPGHIHGTLERLQGGPFGWAAMVGDSANDINAARAAGVPSVAVSFGYTPIPVGELGADRLVDHYDDLPAALVALGG